MRSRRAQPPSAKKNASVSITRAIDVFVARARVSACNCMKTYRLEGGLIVAI
jgi:hypothetical protein